MTLNAQTEVKDLGTLLVLASGGVDSSTLLWLCAEQGVVPNAFFVDYGQPAAKSESAAIEKLCDELRVPRRCVRYSGRMFGEGEIRGRNAYLLHTALMEFPSQSGVVLLGIHAGTGYYDCSPEFIDAMQLSYEVHTGGAITIATPFLHWTKPRLCTSE